MVLTTFGVIIFITMKHQMLSTTDEGLAEELSEVLDEVKRAESRNSLHDWLVRRFSQHEGFDFQVTAIDGASFFSNPRLAGKSLPLPELHNSETPLYGTVQLAEPGRRRIVTVRVPAPEGPLTVQVARSLESYDAELQQLLLVLLLSGPLTLLVALSGGYFLARRALAPVDRMTKTAAQVTAERLDQRVEVANAEDELGRLAKTFNAMIERLERSFREMQQFTADAAHELRTPLAVIRNEAEVALRSPRSEEEYCHVLENLLEETNRLTHMTEQLLFLCRHDAGLHRAGRDVVSLHDLLEDVVGHMQLVAQEKGIDLRLENNPACQVLGEYHQLRRVFFNLLDNAIKYTPTRGQVSVCCETSKQQVNISTADTGVGISADHLPLVFNRFYRVDASRTTDGNGTGLGLSISQSIVQAHQGAIDVKSVVGKGTEVTVSLPVYNVANSQAHAT